MSVSDLEISEIVVAKIIDTLLENGLKPCTLRESDFGVDSDRHEFIYTCFKWLEAEGLVYVQEIHQGLEKGVVILVNPSLTSKGFNILGLTFIGKPGTETVGAALKTVASENKSYAGIGDLVGGILGGFTKSMSS